MAEQKKANEALNVKKHCHNRRHFSLRTKKQLSAL